MPNIRSNQENRLKLLRYFKLTILANILMLSNCWQGCEITITLIYSWEKEKKNWLYLVKQKLCITQKLYSYLYPKESLLHTYQETCTRTFTELFAIAKNWNELKCPSIAEKRSKMCYVHTML